MRKYYETKIGKIIEKEFDSRTEMMALTYIMDKGIDNIKNITEEKIMEIKGNGLMGQNFCQALVRCTVKIANECTPMEIMEYIRLHAHFAPYPEETTFFKDDFDNHHWQVMCDILNDEPETEFIKALVIKEE